MTQADEPIAEDKHTAAPLLEAALGMPAAPEIARHSIRHSLAGDAAPRRAA
ncbi:MAG TPA: hypothetical protein VFC56_10270 [Stellaceae bacterium]|nr:hypothetical protein [Stellaceae bacterium]